MERNAPTERPALTDRPEKAAQSALQREILQTRPFSSLGQEATLGLLRTVDILRRRFSETMAPWGITQQQYNVLRILRGAGEEGLPTLAIAERMLERTPGVTRLVDRLVAKGWVRRQRCAEDRRRVDCTITAAGLDLLKELDGPVEALDGVTMSMLDDTEKRQLIDLLDRIRAGLA
ncbi:MAG: MarR family transcriptional regulator [Acidobacteriota bacterium]